MTKIIGLANSCKECPNRHYYSSGAYECALVQNSRLNADNSIPGWCPLPNYPATLSTESVDKPVHKLSDEQITDVWNSMPGGYDGFLKSWGYIQFARALLAASDSQGGAA